MLEYEMLLHLQRIGIPFSNIFIVDFAHESTHWDFVS